MVPEILAPLFIKLLASPIGAIIVRMPQSAAQVRAMLRQSGHTATFDAGRIPEVELRVLEGAGHLPWLDDPASVGALLNRFLMG